MLIRRAIKISESISKRYLTTHKSYLEVNDDKENHKFHYFWLRDHCRCDKCYNRVTEQVNLNVLDLPSDIQPKECHQVNKELIITWPDDHKSVFSLDWLKSVKAPEKIPIEGERKIEFWDKNSVEDLSFAKVTYEDFMKTNGEKPLLESILKYGFGFVTNVKVTTEATIEVIERIGYLQKNPFGDLWEIKNEMTHSDTAYTNVELGPHTDCTYMQEANGIQTMHMLEHDGTGGESILVDGFNSCNNLREKDPEAFEILCKYPMTYKYVEKGMHYFSTDYIIKLHPLTGKLNQLRYNIIDRDVINTIPFEKLMQFYKAYVALGREIYNDNSMRKFKLNPGTVMFFDNWRLLHGRTAFTGNRKLCGSYMSRSDFINKATLLGLATY